MIKLTSDKKMLEYDDLKLYSNIFCFSTTRYGGVSEQNYNSFNCNEFCGDKLTNVIENRKILCNLLPKECKKLIIPHQTHSTNVLKIDESFLMKDEISQKTLLEGIDALITNIPGYCLCVSTADCIPLILYDKVKHVIASIHAGWRGTVAHIVSKTVLAMIDSYNTNPNDIIACIGPGISVKAFEVGDEVVEEFEKEKFNINEIAVKYRQNDKWHIDLWKANKEELLKVKVKESNIHISNICTYYNNDIFFSARRMGIKSGRILSGILITK